MLDKKCNRDKKNNGVCEYDNDKSYCETELTQTHTEVTEILKTDQQKTLKHELNFVKIPQTTMIYNLLQS